MSYELKKMSRPTTRNDRQISDEDGESESDEYDTELLKDSRKKQSAVKISGKEETSSLSEDAIQRKMAFWRKTAEDEYKSARQTELKKLTGTHTTICIDVSDSMKQNNAWEQTRTFVTDYLSGMRGEYAKGNKYHNIALVTFGHATKIQHRLTNDLEALERIMENITPGGPSPLLAGLILSKASVTVSNFRFANVEDMCEPPKIIVVTDGKATNVHQLKELYDQEHHKSAQELIIDEIRSMKEDDIDINFVYVGNPDIVFLHHLRGISEGELLTHTSGQFLAKYFAIKKDILLLKTADFDSEHHGTCHFASSAVNCTAERVQTAISNQYHRRKDDDEEELSSEREKECEKIDNLFKYESEETVLRVFSDDIDKYGRRFSDQSGRTLLHRAVENNFLSVADLFIYCGVNPLSNDEQSRTPLHIAIEKGLDEMAAFIVSKLNNFVVRLLFGDNKSEAGWLEAGTMKQNIIEKGKDNTNDDAKRTVEPMFEIKELIRKDLDKTLLQVLDSFVEEQPNGRSFVHVKLLDTDDYGREPNNEDFNIENHTAFQRLTSSGNQDALNHPVIRAYVDYKWNQWYQRIFLFKFCFYLFGLFCLTYSAVTGATASDVHTYDTPLQYSRAVMEVISYLYALAVLYSEIRQMLRQKRFYFAKFFNFLELFSAILMIVVLPLRYTNLRAHWYVFALGYFLWAIRIFKYGFVFSQTSVYAEVIKRILRKDFVQFSMLMLVINMIFSGTFLLVLKADDSLDAHIETSSVQGILYVGVRTLIEAGPIVDYTGSDGYRVAGTIVMLVYMFFTIVVMLNILIAQLSETYRRTHEECMKNVYTHRITTLQKAMRHANNTIFSKFFVWTKYYKPVIRNVKYNEMPQSLEETIDALKTKLENIERICKTNCKKNQFIKAIKGDGNADLTQ